MGDYSRPDMLVTTDWVAKHGQDEGIRLLEVDLDTEAYDISHIRGAVGVDWTCQLCDTVRRDILSRGEFEELCSGCGITNDTTVVFYGDNSNWFAIYALWQFRIYGHSEDRLKVMNGGRIKWEVEGRELVKDVPTYKRTRYTASEADRSIRAFRGDIADRIAKNRGNLVDVRSPAEFSGEIIAPPGMTETAQRGGHIPGASNIPWAQGVAADGTFKSHDELRELYEGGGIDLGRDAIVYCRIGERSSHTWFALKYLLGVKECKNYDGSWTEWGNLVGAPIAKTYTG